MAYQVTARKWRPQTFDDIVEQQHVTRTLTNAIRLGRVAHAYLFAGTRGVGKTTMARALAKALNCEQGPTAEPCGACSSCLDITQGASLDIVEIDGASNRGIDEIRDLRENLRYLPSRGRYKVYIIDEVHMLTKEAFNALLKTLEEPPPHVVFIFATTELEKIPYTIISRCQRFEFKRVSLAGIVAQLEHIVHNDGITISRTSLVRIAKAAEGSMRDAQSLLDQVVAYCGVEVNDDDVGHLLGSVGIETLAGCLSALLQQDAETALQTADQLQSEGHEAAGIMRALLEGLRHCIVMKTTDHPEELIPLAEADLDVLRTVAELATVEELYGHFQTLSTAEQSLRMASNPFMLLEMALVRMAHIGRVQSLDTLLESLQRLEQGLPLPPAGSGSGQAVAPPIVPTTPVTSRLSPDVITRQTQVLSDAQERVPSAEPAASPGLDQASPDTGEEPPEAAHDFWRALQEYVVGRRPSLAAFLQPGRVLVHDEGKLVIGFAEEDKFARESLRDRENLAEVRAAVEAVAGRPLQVDIVALEEARQPGGSRGTETPAVVSRSPHVSDEMRQQKKETIQAVLDIFDGVIIT